MGAATSSPLLVINMAFAAPLGGKTGSCQGALSMWDTPPIFFLRHQKDCVRRRVSEPTARRAALGRRQMRRARWKRKNVRRDFGRRGPKLAYHTGAGRIGAHEFSMAAARARRDRSGPGSRSPRRGACRGRGCKTAFDALLFPRVPLRYALPVPSRGNGRMWTSAPTGALSARRPQGPTPQGGFSCPCGAIHLLSSPVRYNGFHRPPVQRQRKEAQKLCEDRPDDRRTRHAG